MRVQDKEAVMILSRYDLGAGKKGAADGPLAVKDETEHLGIVFDEFEILDGQNLTTSHISHDFGRHIEDVLEASIRLNNKVKEFLDRKKFPIILSGDHSNAIGGFSGLKNAFPDKRIGIIWIDAHADLHSPYTTPSGNLHGMPLAVLSGLDNRSLRRNEVSEDLAYYWEELKKLGVGKISPKFDLKDLVFIGIRDAEKEEWDIIRNMGIKTFEPADIRQLGMKEVLAQAIDHLKNCDLFYVSFDADSLDPGISIGTGTIAPDGLKIDEAEVVFETLLNHPKTGAFEITEVNPHLDAAGKEMAKVIAGLLYHGLTQ